MTRRSQVQALETASGRNATIDPFGRALSRTLPLAVFMSIVWFDSCCFLLETCLLTIWVVPCQGFWLKHSSKFLEQFFEFHLFCFPLLMIRENKSFFFSYWCSILGNPIICATGKEPECNGTTSMPMPFTLNNSQSKNLESSS